MKRVIPAVVTSKGKLCPVCGRVSYSLGGIHPQCSFFRADQQVLASRRVDRASAVIEKGKP